jgi:hypothetical protein
MGTTPVRRLSGGRYVRVAAKFQAALGRFGPGKRRLMADVRFEGPQRQAEEILLSFLAGTFNPISKRK